MNWLTRYTLLDNSLQAWLTAIGIIVLILVVLAIATRVAARRLGTVARQGTTLDRVLESMAFMLRGTRWWLMFFVAQHFGLQVLACRSAPTRWPARPPLWPCCCRSACGARAR